MSSWIRFYRSVYRNTHTHTVSGNPVNNICRQRALYTEDVYASMSLGVKMILELLQKESWLFIIKSIGSSI